MDEQAKYKFRPPPNAVYGAFANMVEAAQNNPKPPPPGSPWCQVNHVTEFQEWGPAKTMKQLNAIPEDPDPGRLTLLERLKIDVLAEACVEFEPTPDTEVVGILGRRFDGHQVLEAIYGNHESEDPS